MANRIHPTAILEGEIELGDDNEVGPYSVLYGPLRMGNRNVIGSHVCLGATPSGVGHRERLAAKRTEFGDDNIVGPHSTIERAANGDRTFVGNRVFIMNGAGLGHDCRVQDDVFISAFAAQAGNVVLLRGANIGLSSTLHQNLVIGHFTIVAMNSAVSRNLRPFAKFIPGKALAVNTHAVKKFGFAEYEPEITEYVLHGTAPASPVIKAIVDEYNEFHERSGRPMY